MAEDSKKQIDQLKKQAKSLEGVEREQARANTLAKVNQRIAEANNDISELRNLDRAEEANEMMRRFKAEKEELHLREVHALREKVTKTKETISLLERTYREEKEQYVFPFITSTFSNIKHQSQVRN